MGTEHEANILKYGDNKADGRVSLGGRGQMIKFTRPPKDGKINGIQIHGSRYGYKKGDFLIYVLSEDMSDILHTQTAPYYLFPQGSNKWIRIRFKKAIEVPNTFWIVLDFKAHRTKGVYVSFDTSTKGAYSKMGLPGQDTEDVNSGGDWMIHVLLGNSSIDGCIAKAEIMYQKGNYAEAFKLCKKRQAEDRNDLDAKNLLVKIRRELFGKKAVILEGIITDDNKNPIKGVEITIYTKYRKYYVYSGSPSARTNDNGEYHVELPILLTMKLYSLNNEKCFRIGLFHPEFASVDGKSRWDISIPPYNGSVLKKNFTMTSSGTLSGIITNQKGQPVKNITLGILVAGAENAKTRFFDCASTNAKGYFKVDGLFPQTYNIVNLGKPPHSLVGQAIVKPQKTTNVMWVITEDDNRSIEQTVP